jgi:hypothetical protein
MKFYRRIWINERGCPPELFATIVGLGPECRGRDFFHLEAKPGEEANAECVERILALCKEHGLDKIKGAYSYSVLPHYEASDLQAAPLLRLWTQRRMFKGLNSDKRDDQGRVVLPAAEAKPSIRMASIWPKPWIVVSDRTRRVLEEGGLASMKFDEVAIKGHSVHASPDPFWELRSKVILPKMVNSVPDTTIDWELQRYLIHGPYGEPRYREGDLRPLGAFDIAHTWERLSAGEPGLLVSQRFYQHCLKNKIPLEVRPARVEPD